MKHHNFFFLYEITEVEVEVEVKMKDCIILGKASFSELQLLNLEQKMEMSPLTLW